MNILHCVFKTVVIKAETRFIRRLLMNKPWWT